MRPQGTTMIRHQRLGPLLVPALVILSCGIVVVPLLLPVSPRTVSRASLRVIRRGHAQRRPRVGSQGPSPGDATQAGSLRLCLRGLQEFRLGAAGVARGQLADPGRPGGRPRHRERPCRTGPLAGEPVGGGLWDGAEPRPDQPPGWSINCLACHMAEIDGVAYFGAGTKLLDERILADTVKMVTSSAGRYRLPTRRASTTGWRCTRTR